MAADLANYFAYGQPFEEVGHIFKAWQPANADAKQVVIIQAFAGRKLVREVEVQMMHENRWGVDVEDAYQVEQATEKLVRELTPPDT